MPAEPADPVCDPDPLGLNRPAAPLRPSDRLVGLLADLGLSPRAAVAGFALGLVALLAWFWLRSPAPPPAEAGIPLATVASTAVTEAGTSPVTGTGGVVLAHAAGAVRRPGLYQLVAGDRVADLLDVAGGATRAADLDRINLAAPVVDGTQVIVPRRGEAAPAAPASTGASTSSDTPAVLVDLNVADLEELETLPGVGPATGAAIIEYREANGAFTSVDELIDVPGIGEAKLAAVADLVTV